MDTSTTKKTILTSLVLVAASLCFIVTEKHLGAQDEPMPYAPGAFGVWGWDWLTTGGDAQRSSSVRNDRWISRAAVASPGPRLIYKISLPNTSRQMNALSQPLLVQTARGLTGFKSMGYVAGSGGTAFGFDFDTSQVIWKTPLGAAPEGAGTLACPGGLTTSLGRPTPLTIPNVTDTEAGRGVAPGNLPSARKSGSAIGKPGQGAPIVDALANAAANGGGGAGRGGGFGGSGGRGGGRGGASGVFALAADGMLHQLSMQQGFDIVMRPAPFLPPNANASGLIVVDNVAYAATSNDCAGVPNGIWALDLASPARAVTSWKTGGANIAGTAGPAFDANGTLYVATGEGPGDYANSIVTLAPKTLTVSGHYSPGSPFNSSPVAFSDNGRNLVAASNHDGKLYLLDGATEAAASAKYTNNTADYAPGALASWADSTGTRWILAPVSGPLATGSGFNGAVTNGAIVAFKVTSRPDGKPSLTPAWVSRDLVSPVAPVVVNGVVFALSSGEFHSSNAALTAQQRAQRSQPAVLYALDAFTGKELWNSGRTITSFSPHSAGLASAIGQIYVTTWDSTIYAFGFEEKE